ncbi:Gluconate transport-inducing protein [Coemansia spiralis]|uniref:Gluconate transport-inducing protein n=2 Tax=Coemansia TaxID=4863 RepID=A0A9W8KXR4_9FUNG|nr:Gluconate transport-inducing protein [Coemansia umbellata]KAJ2621019.1 Gluconate transport-inducing protein [Coemansia sp. RSA 1358]KAJ2675768.1 Gluconate transport-inducing protein [Coemansia spiralis]
MTETYHGFIDTAHDALLIFEACNAGLLPRVQRRFSDRERQTIRSGAVYVWDEEETGMRRWTDGRTWSPSRVHGCFLIYYELEGRRPQFVSKNSTTNGRGPRGSRASVGQNGSSLRHTPYEPSPPNIMQKEQGLIKKALSLCTNDKRKLHLVCYYSRDDVEVGCLTSPTNDPAFNGIQIYEERYPEISYGTGRLDRYSGARLRASLNQKAYNPPSTSDGQPAYVRSSMTLEKRSRPYRSEVYRYPSYGPYSGPVRHVTVSNAYPQQQQQNLPENSATSVASAPVSGSSTHGSSHYHSSSLEALPPPPPTPHSDTIITTLSRGGGGSHHHYAHQQHHMPPPPPASDNNNINSNGSGGASYPSAHCSDYTSSPNPCSAVPAPWKTAPIASTTGVRSSSVYHTTHMPASNQPYSEAMTAPMYRCSSPSAFLSPPPSNSGQPPVWQHSEPPRVYIANISERHAAPPHASEHQQQYHHQKTHMWSNDTSGLMIQISGKRPGSRASPQQHSASQQQMPPAPSFASPTATYTHQKQRRGEAGAHLMRLPSIEKLSTIPLPSPLSTPSSSEQVQQQSRWIKPVPSAAIVAESTGKMNSEDMRQLASLRLSLHQ